MKPEQIDITDLIRDAREIMSLLGVTAAADVLPELRRRLSASDPAAEPQQAEASTLLDLVRQYGGKRYMHGRSSLGQLSDSQEYEAAADALLARITALLPEQPVQARSRNGPLWWIHGCGAVTTCMEQPEPSCSAGDSGPWRPLLVGDTRAPERDPGRCPTCGSPQPSMHPAVGGGGEITALCVDRFHAVPGRPDRCLCEYVEVGQQPVQARWTNGKPIWQHACGSMGVLDLDTLRKNGCEDCEDLGPWRPLLVGSVPVPTSKDFPAVEEVQRGGIADSLAPQSRPEAPAQPDLMTQVMAELGVDEPGDVPGALEKRLDAIIKLRAIREELILERDEARGEVERLKLRVNDEIEQADEHAAWADRLAWAALKRAGVRETEEASGNEELWQLALAALVVQPDPLVLSLPEVPEGAVALVDRHKRRWTPSEATDIAALGGDRLALWESGSGALRTYAALLAGSGPLTVELAPPREPRAAG